MRVGFACAWQKSHEKTWSGTTWKLREALRRHTEVVNLDVEYSTKQTLLKHLYTRRRHGRWASAYRWSSSREKMIERKLHTSLRESAPVDAVVEIGDLAAFDIPFYPYKDLSFAVLENNYDPKTGAPGFKGIDLDTIKRLRERQHKIWESATGIFVMSEWLADALLESSNVPRNKVTVVYAGLNSIETATGGQTELTEERSTAAKDSSVNLLFVGRDFLRKGGDIVVRALGQLRREYSSDIQLTVAGPDRWPLSGGIPDGITFLGNCSNKEVAKLYRTHDLFVMPSRFEAFGIAFREAMANGMPIVGRDAFAMSEIIEPGRNGALVRSDDPVELACAIVTVLEDPQVLRCAADAAQGVRERFSWDAVAERMLAAMKHPG